jgi:hypothetical protein
LEETDDHDGLGVFNRGSDHGKTAPENHHRGEPEARLDIVKRQVGWHLANDVSRRPSVRWVQHVLKQHRLTQQ